MKHSAKRILRVLVVTALLFVSAASLIVNAQTQLSADEFESKLAASAKGQLIDVRTPQEYKEGHLANSNNIDYKAAYFEKRIEKLDKNQPVFLYCLSGGRSSAAAKKFAENGFTQVYDMKGGFLKWSSSGKKVDGEEHDGSQGMSMADFTKIITSSQVVLVDFYAKWCAPCIQMLPTITRLKSEYHGRVNIETINYDPNKILAKELGIDEIPAFLLYKDGKLVTRKNGLLEEKDFRQLIDSSL